MDSSQVDAQSKLVVVSMLSSCIVLWCLFRGYQGFAGDAQLYAFQAFARLHPNLATDLYLQNINQDKFTAFSFIYSAFVRLLGLPLAAQSLTAGLTLCLYVAAWKTVEAFSEPYFAWMAVGLLIVSTGDFGGSGVFHFSERYLTARLPAEALSLTAIACHLRGRLILSAIAAVAAMLFHPLMALPALLVLIGLQISNRLFTIGALSGLVLAIAMSVFSYSTLKFAHFPVMMDSEWLSIVRERSQFLFPQLWSSSDWFTNLRPVVYLLLMITTLDASNAKKKISLVALIVGLTGIAIACVPGAFNPIAILVQGQAWRWIWTSTLVSTLLLPDLIYKITRDRPIGFPCAVLLIGGWFGQELTGAVCLALACLVWIGRGTRWSRHALAVRLAAWVAALIGIGLIVEKHSAIHHLSFAKVGQLPSTKLVCAALFGLLSWRLYRGSFIKTAMATAVFMTGTALALLPIGLKPTMAEDVYSNGDSFHEWREKIPPTATVLVTPSRDVGAFVWFTLQRPNYLSLDQSAGVVFSRATALEVKRRSDVLLALVEPSWKILSKTISPVAHPLSLDIFKAICADPSLNFVVSPESMDAPSTPHTRQDSWMNWKLYDCANAH